SASLRRDGSSRFSSENRWGNFSSVSGGWRLSGEDFVRQFLPAVVDDLKIRGSVGTLGNTEDIGNYEYQAFINTFSRYILGNDQHVAPGSIQRSLINTDIRWESTKTTNIGIDLSLFSHALQLT